jgi:CRP-like cAMP-binding protein
MPETLSTIGPIRRLAQSPAFNELDPTQVGKILESAKRYLYNRGELVLFNGEVRPLLYIVEAGMLALSPSEWERPMTAPWMVGAGEMIGHRAFLCKEPSPYAATAALPTVLVGLEAKHLAELRKSDAAVAHRLVMNVLRDLLHNRRGFRPKRAA